jgi:hypothetical protein
MLSPEIIALALAVVLLAIIVLAVIAIVVPRPSAA